MVQTYDFTGSLPDIPVPHDCVIKRIDLDDSCIVFDFVDDITKFDSARFYCPAAKSLRIRYHFSDLEYELFEAQPGKDSDGRAAAYVSLPDDALTRLTERKYKLEYLSHYVSYRAMILVLFSGRELRLELRGLERVSYEWIE